MADRVLQDVCESVTDSDDDPRYSKPKRNRKRRPRKKSQNPKMKKFNYREAGDEYSDDQDVSSEDNISEHEMNYTGPMGLRP